jgi:hypothetical protein
MVSWFFDFAIYGIEIFSLTSDIRNRLIKSSIFLAEQSTTHTSLDFPSGPISTLGGLRKFVSRKICGGIFNAMMSARLEGRFNLPERISSAV